MKSKLKKVWRRIKSFFNFLWRNFQFSTESSKKATIGLFIFAAIFVITLGAFLKIGIHPWVDPFAGVLYGAVFFFLCGAGVLLGFKLINLLPRFFKDWGILLLGGVVAIFTILFEPKIGIPFGLLFVIVESLFFTALFLVFSKKN